MKIEGNENIKYIPNKRNIETQDIRQMELQKGTSKPEAQMERVASYEKSSMEEGLFLYDPASIERLGKLSEDLYGRLVKMLESLVKEQAEVVKIIKELETGKTLEQHLQTKETTEQVKEQIVKLLIGQSMEDKLALEELKESIGPKGRLGVETMSEKILDFVKAASDDRIGRIKVLTDLIESTFKEIGDTLDKMPELSQRTYERIIEKLDILLSITILKEEPENALFQLKEMIKDIIREQFESIERLKDGELVETRQGLINKSSIDNSDISKTRELLSSEGRLGSKSISERVVAFVKLASGEKGQGLDDLVRTIDKGFKELEQSLGVLPQLTQETQAKIKQDLEDWLYILEMRKHPGPVIFIENRNFFRRMNIKYKLNKRGYIFLIFALVMLFHIIKAVIQYLGQN